jgi:tyrosyl-tRNA synthetase
VHDSFEQIKKKINGAYCPEKVSEGNPIFDYLDKIIIDDKDSTIRIERPEKFGGTFEAKNFDELVRSYRAGQIHPADMKAFVAEELEKRVRPIREHFEKNSAAKALYEEVKSYTITR